MARKTDLQKHTLHLRRGDWDFIETVGGPNGIATSVIIRTIVSNFVDERRGTEHPPALENLEVKI